MLLKKLLSGFVSQSKKHPYASAGIMFISGIIFWGGFNTAMEATNTLPFCISCHEMGSTVYPEYKKSIHFTNSTGVQATCPDCHVPKEWIPKVIRKVQATKELYYWMTGEIDTAEKFQAKRLHLAEKVWHSMKQTDSRECRNCHQFSVMDLNSQARFAARIHEDAIIDGATCIDCHQGIAHHLPQMAVAETEKKPALDMEYAEEINETCAGCHGEFGEGTIDGEYPRLAGMNAEYLAKQLRHFKTRERLNIPMTPYTTDRELPEEDVVLITAYLAQIELPTKLAPIEDEQEFDALDRLQKSGKVINVPIYSGNINAGHRFYKKECAGCHGEMGWGDKKRNIPQLAGQYSLYLKRQISKFAKSERLHDDPRDADIFKSFGDSEINDMLAFLSVADDE